MEHLFSPELAWVAPSYRLNWRGWLLPIAYLATLLVQIDVLLPFPTWGHFLIPIVGTIIVLVVLLLVAVRFLFCRQIMRISRPLVVVGLSALLIAPTIWTTLPVLGAYSQAFPIAGPPSPSTPITPLLSQYEHAFATPDPAMIHYLITHQGKADDIVATTDSRASSALIIETGKPVLTLGGYEGLDHILTRNQVSILVHQGKLRFFLYSDYKAYGNIPFALRYYFFELSIGAPPLVGQQDITQWVQLNCMPVMPASWGSSVYGPGGTLTSNSVLSLYDCAGAS